ncbi:MAG TPA: TetR/AcrR family transcriptional regulator, partial [Chloroflexaceae bacterium]|nr:TetR/AcrR family transcriptional regulator [Chloroflexaceae bacterium]
MPRTVNKLEYAEKRAEILAVARRLVYTRGYEQMTIQDILGELQISKGAFYHYFDSKQALLEGLVEAMQREGEQIFAAIVRDPALPTLAKLQRFFDAANSWKSAQKEYLLALVRVWHHDHNAVVRQKAQARMAQLLVPLLTEVVQQGHGEGSLSTPFPELAGEVALSLLVGLGEAIAQLLLAQGPPAGVLARAEGLVAAYNDALERVLGAPAGSLHL